jgi:ABC-type oligopeptide transport system ATPase subunit
VIVDRMLGVARDEPAASPDAPAIRVEGLVKRYRKAERNAVDGISFDVRPGEFFALLGPNGAGKTTTLSILTTTLTPTGGRALIDGLDVVADAAAVRQRVGIIFQRPSLDKNLTGEENVRFHAILYDLYPYAPAYRLMAAGYRRQVEEWSGRWLTPRAPCPWKRHRPSVPAHPRAGAAAPTCPRSRSSRTAISSSSCATGCGSSRSSRSR